MIREFEVIMIKIHHNRGLLVFARHLGPNHNFSVTEGSLFGDLPIYHDQNFQPKDEDDNPRQDIFVFRPTQIERIFDRQFKEGQRVTLNIPD